MPIGPERSELVSFSSEGKMRIVLSLAVLLVWSGSYATEPSLPLKMVGSLKAATRTPTEVKSAIASELPVLQKLLNTESRTYHIYVKDGDARDILSGAITTKELPANDVDFIWNHAQVSANAEGPAFQVRIPLIAKKSYGIVKDGRFLVKLVPQMGSTAGAQTAAGSTIVSSYQFQVSEVESSSLPFFVDKQGAVFAVGGM